MNNEPIRVVLVDDHRLFRDGLGQLLGSDERFRVVGQAGSGEEFLELVGGDATGGQADIGGRGVVRGVDVVLMDIDMPGMGGVQATRRALGIDGEMKIVALSMHGEQEFYLPMVEAGAKGFLLKNSGFAEVCAAAGKVAAGGTYFSPGLMEAMVEAMERDGRGGWREVEALSEREAEVLPLVCEGMPNSQIAERLFISKRTVDKHRANILAKTGCRNAVELVIYAVKNKMI